MQTRRLGQTDIEVSVLGLGTVKWGRNEGVKYPAAFSIPTDDDVLSLLHHAKERGINLIDTAPAYGESEARLGKLLQGSRQDWVLCTKAGEEFTNGLSHFDFSREAITRSVERSLKRLQTDYLDIVLIHSNGEDVSLIEQQEVLLTLQRLKEKGLIRAIGMSTKTIEGGLLALQHADSVMVTARPDYQDEVSVIEQAAVLKKGILVKKALASGHLATINDSHPVLASFRFNLGYEAVSSIIVGTISLSHLDGNCDAISQCEAGSR